MKTCPYCDAPIPDASMKFCGQCGMKLDYEEGEGEKGETAHPEDEGRQRETAAGDVRSSASDYDEAVRVSQETEEQMLQMMGGLATPGGCLMAWGVELQLAMMVMGCFYPAVWAVLGFFYVTICVVGVKRGSVKRRLKAHDIEGAKAALSSLKAWNLVMTLVEVAMAGIEIWGFVHLAEFVKG